MARVFPYLTVADSTEALAFYEQAFGADVFHTVMDDDGKRLAHARFTIEDAVIMITEHFPELPTGVNPPNEIGGTPVTIRLELSSRQFVNQIFAGAPQHGAEVIDTPSLKLWGGYYGRLKDPFGHVWAFSAPAD